jgi:two-component system, NtrC family, sensor kinase
MKPLIYYIDDEPNNLTVMQAIIPSEWELKTFSDPKQALQALETESPWVILSDQRMPGMTGVAYLEIAKKIRPNAVRIIVTGYSEEDLVVESVRKAQIFDYLKKPWDPEEIEASLRRAIEFFRMTEEKKLLQEQLIRSERMAAAGTLARGIGHEFGNILLRIVGKAELSLIHKNPAEMEKSLRTIVDAALRAGVIVRNLQSLVKTESPLEAGSLITPIQDSLSLIAHELKDATITIVEDHDPELPNFPMNRVELGQVFLNLFINAKHAMEPKGGTLSITSTTEPAGIVVSVTDTGSGIPKDVIGRIFDPLFTTKGEKGSGIGLSVSKDIVEKHQGKISVLSAPGQGTTFRIWFPKPKSETVSVSSSPLRKVA